jgi:hypothetical protein
MAGTTTATEFTAAHIGRCVAGHGVASGRAADSPYPAGTISLQAPLFARHGIDLSPYLQATLNLDFSPGEWRLRQPDHLVEQLLWSDRHPPETFSFWRCRLQPLDARIAAVEALIYYPHPETKQIHHQPPALLEVLAPPLGPVAMGEQFQLWVEGSRCRLIQPARLRARLLEFLKFRVLAAQEAFFWDDAAGFRRWLQAHWPEAFDLSDQDLAHTLDQARALYTELPMPPRP